MVMVHNEKILNMGDSLATISVDQLNNAISGFVQVSSCPTGNSSSSMVQTSAVPTGHSHILQQAMQAAQLQTVQPAAFQSSSATALPPSGLQGLSSIQQILMSVGVGNNGQTYFIQSPVYPAAHVVEHNKLVPISQTSLNLAVPISSRNADTAPATVVFSATKGSLRSAQIRQQHFPEKTLQIPFLNAENQLQTNTNCIPSTSTISQTVMSTTTAHTSVSASKTYQQSDVTKTQSLCKPQKDKIKILSTGPDVRPSLQYSFNNGMLQKGSIHILNIVPNQSELKGRVYENIHPQAMASSESQIILPPTSSHNSTGASVISSSSCLNNMTFLMTDTAQNITQMVKDVMKQVPSLPSQTQTSVPSSSRDASLATAASFVPTTVSDTPEILSTVKSEVSSIPSALKVVGTAVPISSSPLPMNSNVASSTKSSGTKSQQKKQIAKKRQITILKGTNRNKTSVNILPAQKQTSESQPTTVSEKGLNIGPVESEAKRQICEDTVHSSSETPLQSSPKTSIQTAATSEVNSRAQMVANTLLQSDTGNFNISVIPSGKENHLAVPFMEVMKKQGNGSTLILHPATKRGVDTEDTLPEQTTPTTKGDYCVLCKTMYEDSCPDHGSNVQHILDTPFLTRARMSIPPQLCLKDVAGSTCVFTKQEVPKQARFGPVVGVLRRKQESDSAGSVAHTWEVFEENDSQMFDCEDEDMANWMKFVRRARTNKEQNLVAYQSFQDIYFITLHTIDADKELCYWYSDDYSKLLGFPQHPEDWFHCNVCGKELGTMAAYKGHMKYNHADMSGRKWKCTQCGKAFSSSAKLSTHTMGHMGVKPFFCHICGKQFTDQSNLRMHLTIHTGERKFQCFRCSKTFRQKAHLSSHMLTHTGEKKLRCQYCDKRFARNSDLRQHVFQHTKEQMFPCEDCGKVFYKRQNYKKHVKMHSGIRDYICPLCQKSYATKYHMQRHLSGCKGKKDPVSNE